MIRSLTRLRSMLGAARLAARRRRFTRGLLHGQGLEIGALHAPFPVPNGVSVSYVDRLSTPELRHHYPELAALPLVPVDRIDDGERLRTVESASQDFVIASHVLEHCEDPIGAIGHWLRVVRTDGVVILAVPDARHSFDRGRPITALDHLLRDASEGPEGSRSAHYREWVHHVEGRTGPDAHARAARLERDRYSIHFHVWDVAALRELLHHCAERGPTPSTMLKIEHHRGENLAALRRSKRTEALRRSKRTEALRRSERTEALRRSERTEALRRSERTEALRRSER
ncbi:MAG: methyltransferase domain-containing protein [Acidobacteriota bacterium]